MNGAGNALSVQGAGKYSCQQQQQKKKAVAALKACVHLIILDNYFTLKIKYEKLSN